MLLFWLIAALLAALAGFLILLRAASAQKRVGQAGEAPAVAVYRRQLSELDDLAHRGLLAEDELEASRAEASRRLLSAADTRLVPELPGNRTTRLVVTAVAISVIAATLVVYLKVGRPGLNDQPFQARLAVWSKTDPGRMGPAELAAVIRTITNKHPSDPEAFNYLGRAQMAAGDAGEAARSFSRASRLAPKDPGLHIAYGEALLAAADGQFSPEAKEAFRTALALDPNNGAARYYVARARIGDGKVEEGLSQWRALAASLPVGDQHRQLVEAQIAQVEKTGGLASPATEQANQSAGMNRNAFIQSMVGRLATRLETQPDDPDGWARLVRAYGVLGDVKSKDAALVRARTLFAKRPADLAKVEAEAKVQANPALGPGK
jgi:cytochrome c-type biogenesis protein CcmH